ncbi:unnamed protein product [Owenia fusiformis]|uniref:Uncharacterized protein n=1 Tax=Owenia fusiformis TaxID=6347 RepID=A0A8J1TG59_OWEFU|nr:unnamed protein product [Owenia fusiformis]
MAKTSLLLVTCTTVLISHVLSLPLNVNNVDNRFEVLERMLENSGLTKEQRLGILQVLYDLKEGPSPDLVKLIKENNLEELLGDTDGESETGSKEDLSDIDDVVSDGEVPDKAIANDKANQAKTINDDDRSDSAPEEDLNQEFYEAIASDVINQVQESIIGQASNQNTVVQKETNIEIDEDKMDVDNPSILQSLEHIAALAEWCAGLNELNPPTDITVEAKENRALVDNERGAVGRVKREGHANAKAEEGTESDEDDTDSTVDKEQLLEKMHEICTALNNLEFIGAQIETNELKEEIAYGLKRSNQPDALLTEQKRILASQTTPQTGPTVKPWTTPRPMSTVTHWRTQRSTVRPWTTPRPTSTVTLWRTQRSTVRPWTTPRPTSTVTLWRTQRSTVRPWTSQFQGPTATPGTSAAPSVRSFLNIEEKEDLTKELQDEIIHKKTCCQKHSGY